MPISSYLAIFWLALHFSSVPFLYHLYSVVTTSNWQPELWSNSVRKCGEMEHRDQCILIISDPRNLGHYASKILPGTKSAMKWSCIGCKRVGWNWLAPDQYSNQIAMRVSSCVLQEGALTHVMTASTNAGLVVLCLKRFHVSLDWTSNP